jgi:hypothetical protein
MRWNKNRKFLQAIALKCFPLAKVDPAIRRYRIKAWALRIGTHCSVRDAPAPVERYITVRSDIASAAYFEPLKKTTDAPGCSWQGRRQARAQTVVNVAPDDISALRRSSEVAAAV